MPHYLFQVSYSADSWAGLLKNPENRRETISKMFESVGGKLESFYFAFGAHDVVVIATLPDNVSAGAVAVAAASSGAVASMSTTVLMTAEEGQEVLRKAGSVGYARPGTS
jgi:uncharacterized protein with GYD domain